MKGIQFIVWMFAIQLTAQFTALAPALAHRERPIESPVRPGSIPAIDRVNPNHLVVCKPSSQPTQAQLVSIQARLATATGEALLQAQKDEAAWHRNTALFAQCCFDNIQDAVNAAGDNTDILIMPGIYREEPSRAAPSSSEGDLENGAYSYEYHVAHPNDANLIAILGKKNITLEGTGGRPDDVLIDAGFVKDVGIRCDRCEGFVARNFWQRNANEHGVYTVDSDGYLYDHVLGSFNREYQLFGFASDNGLMTDCEASGGGDSGFYIGGAPVTPGRFSQTIRNSRMFHNVLGFSGTQGSSVLITGCDVYDNAIGISFNSQNDHPNFPQGHSVVEHNDIHDNNFDIYAATSDVPPIGEAYDFFRNPVGTGLWIIGGEDNIVRNNRVYNNSRFGMILAGNALEMPLPAEVHRNQFVNNLMGTAAGAGAGPNATAFPPDSTGYKPGGSDFFWDRTGDDNCWGPNSQMKTDPVSLPGPCPAPNHGAVVTPPQKQLEVILNCLWAEIPDTHPTQYHTADTYYPCPWGQVNLAPYVSSAQLVCGNGTIDIAEDCDPGNGSANLGGQSCASLSHGTGTLKCDTHCQWDFSSCSVTGPLPTATPRNGCPGGAAVPTASATPIVPTATNTATKTVAATSTPTPVAVAATATPINESGGCAIGAGTSHGVSATGALWLGPSLLMWLRQRVRRRQPPRA
ncbi:MAG: right-handed parallel beta-helix repeat-containing protein [Deltaproteobacteria bacterium]|nr:right-handed parallel beta-helix repeat-containing protein [Deltaproteobacteria bacterium]